MQARAPFTSDKNWFLIGATLALLLTLFRLVFLWLDRTDLFVDEAQYWLWGQEFDFGYYSKPPLVAWVIRLVTELAHSDAIFWVRFPAPMLHLATALILGVLADRLYGAKAAFWAMLSYISLPAVALGSAVISTDTVMAPFFALALLFYIRLLDEKRVGWAVIAGLAAGLAFLAKYAGVYFLVCALVAAVLLPAARPSWRHAAAFFLAFLAATLPNIVWNSLNDLTTLQHTMDNASWLREDSRPLRLHFLKLAEFFFSQFGVFGPILFGGLIYCLFRPGEKHARILLLFSAPIFLIVCLQALLSHAFANWAAAAFFAATVLVVSRLLILKKELLLKLSVAFGMAASLGLPVLTSLAYEISINGEVPVMKRLLGREQMSRDILEAARTAEVAMIVADSREIIADLFYTGRAENMPMRVIAHHGRPRNYYELTFPFRPEEPTQRALLVSPRPSLYCAQRDLPPQLSLATDGGAYHGQTFNAFVVEPACFDDLARY